MESSNYPTMAEALAWLKQKGVAHKQQTDHQIKIGRTLSWYPVRGTIVDGSTRLKVRGRFALDRILVEKAGEL